MSTRLSWTEHTTVLSGLIGDIKTVPLHCTSRPRGSDLTNAKDPLAAQARPRQAFDVLPHTKRILCATSTSTCEVWLSLEMDSPKGVTHRRKVVGAEGFEPPPQRTYRQDCNGSALQLDQLQQTHSSSSRATGAAILPSLYYTPRVRHQFLACRRARFLRRNFF